MEHALNLAAGNMFKAATTLAKTNVELMQYQQELRAETAEGIESMQISCLHAGMSSAKEAKDALDKEATGQLVAGATGIFGAAISFGSMLPCKFGMGDSATKEELNNTNEFEKALNNTKPADDKPVTPQPTTQGAVVTQNRPLSAQKKIDEWMSGDVRNFDHTSDNKALNDLSDDELATVRRNVLNRQSDLKSKLYDQVNGANGRKSILSQGAYTASNAASQFAQGEYNIDKAKDQALSSEYQTQGQVFQEDLNGLSSFAQNAQQAAGNFQQDSLSILANLNTQG